MMTAEDRKLIEDLETCAIPPGEFGHGEHVRVAWALLSESPLAEVIVRFKRSLQRFADHAGAPGLYHETITWAFLFAINERMLRLGREHSWTDFEAAYPELFSDFRGFLETYYSSERLESSLARSHFLLPDRLAPGSYERGETIA